MPRHCVSLACHWRCWTWQWTIVPLTKHWLGSLSSNHWRSWFLPSALKYVIRSCSPGMCVHMYKVVRCELWSSHEYTFSFLHCMLCVQVMGDSTVLKKKVAHCHLKRLELHGEVLLPLLSGAKDNCSITDLYVESEPITTCLHVTILYHVHAL